MFLSMYSTIATMELKLDLGGAAFRDSLRNTGFWVKLKRYVSLHRVEGVKND